MVETDEATTPQQRAAETKKRETRRKLMSGAVAVITEQGWQARLEDVAARAGVSAATLYTVFPTKDDLLLALMDEYVVRPLLAEQHLLQRQMPSHEERVERTKRYFRRIREVIQARRAVVEGAMIARMTKELGTGEDFIVNLAMELLKLVGSAFVIGNLFDEETGWKTRPLDVWIVYTSISAILLLFDGGVFSEGPESQEHFDLWVTRQVEFMTPGLVERIREQIDVERTLGLRSTPESGPT